MGVVMQWAGGVTVLIGALVAVWHLAKRAVRMANRARDIYDDWMGEPARPGVAPRDGLMQRMATLEDGQRAILAELRPNGGASLRDSVDYALAQIADLAQLVAQTSGRVTVVAAAPPAPRGTTYGTPIGERTTHAGLSYVRRH